MIARVRHRGCPPKDIDLGPATGVTHNYALIARTIDTEPRRIRPSFLQGVNHSANVGISLR